jgi:nucleoside-diphosphate-sugar epimerase
MNTSENKRNSIAEQDLEFIINSPLNWEILEGKTVLITGANGFLPAYMVETILFLNETKFTIPAKIIGLVRNLEKAKRRFLFYTERKDLELIQTDVNEPFEYKSPINYIIHAASQASPKYYGVDPIGTLLPNTIGTNNLLRLALKNPIESFLFFSSGEVYGEVDADQIPTKENDYGFLDPTMVRSCYGESKRMGETMCVSYHHQFNTPVKIVRPFHTYGPGMQLDDGRVFADFVADIVNDRDIIMKSDGSAIRAFCYLADAIVGFFTVLLKGKNGEAYNIGNPLGETSIKELAYTLIKLFPKKKLKVIETHKSTDNYYLKSNISRNCPDITKIENLGWTPYYSVPEGFKRTIESYK